MLRELWKVHPRQSVLESVLQLARKRVIHGLKFLSLSFVIFAVTLIAYNLYDRIISNKLRKSPVLVNVTYTVVVKSSVCRIPHLELYDPIVIPYLKRVQSLNCSFGRGSSLVASNATALYVNERALLSHGITNAEDFKCCYSRLYRSVDRDDPSDSRYRTERKCTYFKTEVSVEEIEFLRVKCFVGQRPVQEDYHAFVPKKRDVEERCRNASPAADKDALSVLILGIDSMSRLNMHRQMPKTIQRLKELGAVEMLGFNKVGDNTFPNLVPILTALSEEELKAKCWSSNESFFDKCHFIWDDFRDAGYRTAFVEDTPWIGAFNYLKKGFKKQPTDYYPRPFFGISDKKIGHTRPLNVKLCLGDRTAAKVFLKYVSEFSLTFKSDLAFGLFWENTLSHDFFNLPRPGDDLHASFFERLEASGALDRSALIMMSDHGMRWGRFRLTYQGRMEERLPPLFLVLPKWFRDRYSTAVANLMRNVHRLTSPFDLHETLWDLMRPTQRLTQEATRRRSLAVMAHPTTPPRGISLFLQIPPNRTCADSGIPSEWCSCESNVSTVVESAVLNKTAEVLVDHINEIVRPFRQCSRLQLNAVKSVQVQVPQEHLKEDATDQGVLDYVFVVRTVPGNAVFEGTVRHRVRKGNFSVVGYVSRLNLYGRQSACVHNYRLKLYCFCSS